MTTVTIYKVLLNTHCSGVKDNCDNLQGLANTHCSGVKDKCDNLQGLVNTHCSGNVSMLANEISYFFESVTKDFPPLVSFYLRELTP